MKNLTTPQAILFGFGLVALAIASIPYSSHVVTPALRRIMYRKLQYVISIWSQVYRVQVSVKVVLQSLVVVSNDA